MRKPKHWNRFGPKRQYDIWMDLDASTLDWKEVYQPHHVDSNWLELMRELKNRPHVAVALKLQGIIQ